MDYLKVNKNLQRWAKSTFFWLLLSLCQVLLIATISVSAAPAAGQVSAPVPDVPLSGAVAPKAQLAIESLDPADTLGVQTTGYSMVTNGAAALSSAGAKFMRMPIRWSSLAPTDIEPAAYDWTALDNAISLAVSEGYELIGELDHNPDWAASWERGPVNCVPLSRFTDFVDAVVTRYSAAPYNVKYWEVYNEPDSASGTASTPTCTGSTDQVSFGDHPADYVTHLQAAYNTVEAIDPSAVVLLGGIAYDYFTTDGGVFIESFLDDILSLGADDYFDVVNFHYYDFWKQAWELETGLPGVRAKTAAIKTIMEAHNVDKPVVCTEMGSSSGGPPPYWPSATEDSQAIEVIRQFTQSIAAGNKVSIWYNMADYGYVDGFAEYGLLDVPSYTPKLAVDALTTLSDALAGYEYIRALDAAEMGATDLEGYLFWDQGGDETLMILWSADGSDQTLTLPSGVSSIVDKFGDPVAHTSTLDIDEQPVLITRSAVFDNLFLPLVER
jgi:hypothetical protein